MVFAIPWLWSSSRCTFTTIPIWTWEKTSRSNATLRSIPVRLIIYEERWMAHPIKYFKSIFVLQIVDCSIGDFICGNHFWRIGKVFLWTKAASQSSKNILTWIRFTWRTIRRDHEKLQIFDDILRLVWFCWLKRMICVSIFNLWFHLFQVKDGQKKKHLRIPPINTQRCLRRKSLRVYQHQTLVNTNGSHCANQNWPLHVIKLKCKCFVLFISGYGATCVALLAAATTILKEKELLPTPGVLPPGACFAKTSLISNLSKNGFNFEVISVQETDNNWTNWAECPSRRSMKVTQT